MKIKILGPGGRTWLALRKMKQIYRQFVLEKKFHIGGKKHIGKHFYVIGINQHEEGLFSIVYQVLRHIEYALENNMIPVVNMRDFDSMFFKEGFNAWEHFFEQPCGYSLDDIEGAHKVTFSYDSHYPHLKVCWNVADLKEEDLNALKSLYVQYIRTSSFMMDYISKKLPAVFQEKSKKVGCICRGTDYFDAPKLGIAKQPTAEEMIEKVKECMQKNDVDMVYCATEDQNVYAKFQKAFGNKLIPNIQQKYGRNEGKFLSEVNKTQNIDVYKVNQEYFFSLYMVSQCDFFIGGNVSGTNAVILMNNNFKESYVFRLGAVTEKDVIEFNSKKSV